MKTGPQTPEAREKARQANLDRWADPIWREQELERRRIQKENGSYAKRGESISKTKRERNKGNSCIACGGYRLLLGYGNGGILEHRKVMQDYLERPLEPDEIPHHCDGNKLNNDIENLELVLKSKHFSDYHPDIFKGRPAHNKGIPHTEEAKEKIRQKALGRPGWNKGIPATPQAKENMSKGQYRRWAKIKQKSEPDLK